MQSNLRYNISPGSLDLFHMPAENILKGDSPSILSITLTANKFDFFLVPLELVGNSLRLPVGVRGSTWLVTVSWPV